MEKLLVFNVEKCTGCRTCEMVCSLSKEGICNPVSSRRRVVQFSVVGVAVPMSCQQCEEPACEKVCGTGAIKRDARTGATVIDQSMCIGCKMCMIACPFGAISIEPVNKKMIKCDLCEGDPECVKFCPSGALEYVTADAYGLRKKAESVEKISKLMGAIFQQA